MNFNFTEISKLPAEIGNLPNLEEIYFFPRLFDFPKIVNGEIIQHTIDQSKHKTVTELPNEIVNCKKLKKLDFTSSSLEKLPKQLYRLTNLKEIMIANSQIDINSEMLNFLSIKNDFILDINNCYISDENLNNLKSKENITLISDVTDYEKINDSNQSNQTVDLQLHDTYFTFKNETEAMRYVNSMPKFLQAKALEYLNKS